jgi:hypothetical protein
VSGRLLGEGLLENHTGIVTLLGGGGVVGKSLRADAEHVVVDNVLGVGLETVDPVVADAVGELLLLAEKNLLGEVGLCAGESREWGI